MYIISTFVVTSWPYELKYFLDYNFLPAQWKKRRLERSQRFSDAHKAHGGIMLHTIWLSTVGKLLLLGSICLFAYTKWNSCAQAMSIQKLPHVYVNNWGVNVWLESTRNPNLQKIYFRMELAITTVLAFFLSIALTGLGSKYFILMQGWQVLWSRMAACGVPRSSTMHYIFRAWSLFHAM